MYAYIGTLYRSFFPKFKKMLDIPLPEVLYLCCKLTIFCNGWFMIKKKLCFVCDNPFCDHVKNPFLFYCYSFSEARARGWLISHDRKSCYCPSCANEFKHVGRKGNLITRSLG